MKFFLLLFLYLLSFNSFSSTTAEASARCELSLGTNYDHCQLIGDAFYLTYGVDGVIIHWGRPFSFSDGGCPNGWDYVNKICIPDQPEPEDCPPGSTLVDGQCQAPPKCPDPFNYTGITESNPSGCTSPDPDDPCPDINSSFDFVTGQCKVDGDDCMPGNFRSPITHQCEPITWDCPEGMHPEGNICVSTPPPPNPPPPEFPPPDGGGDDDGGGDGGDGGGDDGDGSDTPTSCPAGFEFNGYVCNPDSDTPNCPTGYFFDPSSRFCKPEAKTPDDDNKCFPGWEKDLSGNCILNEQPEDPPINCPIGTKRVGDFCEAEILCPFGSRLVNGQCQDDPSDCPAGTAFINGLCQRPENACGQGFVWNGSVCVPSDLTTEKRCQPGSTLYKGKCITEFLPCPPGTERSGSFCVNIEDGTDFPVECPPGTQLSGQLCVTNEPSKCPPGYVDIGGECHLKEKFKDNGCKEEPTCVGSPVECAIARQAWVNNCGKQGLTAKQVSTALGYFTTLNSGEVRLADLDEEGYGLSTSCPSSRSYNVLGANFRLDLTPFCSIADIIGNLLLISAGFISIRILSDV